MKSIIAKLIQCYRVRYRCSKDGMEVEITARGMGAPKCPLCGMSMQYRCAID